MGLFKRRTRNFGSFLPLLLVVTPLFAQDKPPDAEDKPAAAENADALRKAAQNPVASLVSVPIQNNNNFSISSGDRTQAVLNIQPVIPVRLTDSWYLIARITTPIIYQPLPPVDTQPTPQGTYGFGDLNPTFFISPSKPSKIIWCVGPAIVLPTATNKFLGQGKWSTGPSLVVLTQPGKWTLGFLVNNVWSFAGQSSRKDGFQTNFILPVKALSFFFKYYDAFSAKAAPEGSTILFGGSWTLRIPKPGSPKPAA
jgi:hypothetical protein